MSEFPNNLSAATISSLEVDVEKLHSDLDREPSPTVRIQRPSVRRNLETAAIPRFHNTDKELDISFYIISPPTDEDPYGSIEEATISLDDDERLTTHTIPKDAYPFVIGETPIPVYTITREDRREVILSRQRLSGAEREFSPERGATSLLSKVAKVTGAPESVRYHHVLQAHLERADRKAIKENWRLRDEKADLRRSLTESHDEFKAQAKESQRLKQVAFIDTVTRQPNRLAAELELVERMDAAMKSGSYFGLMLLDNRSLKSTNAIFEYQNADQMLRNTGKAARTELRKGDFLGRWGGDEWVVYLSPHNASSTEECIEEFKKPIDRIVCAIERDKGFVNEWYAGNLRDKATGEKAYHPQDQWVGAQVDPGLAVISGDDLADLIHHEKKQIILEQARRADMQVSPRDLSEFADSYEWSSEDEKREAYVNVINRHYLPHAQEMARRIKKLRPNVNAGVNFRTFQVIFPNVVKAASDMNLKDSGELPEEFAVWDKVRAEYVNLQLAQCRPPLNEGLYDAYIASKTDSR